MRSISKLLIGAAVAGACGYAAAATLTTTSQGNYSRQGNIQNNNVHIVVPANVLLQDNYVNLDTLRFTASGANFASADQSLHTASFTCSTGTNSVVFTYSQAASSTTLVVYSAGTPSGLTAGSSCPIPTIAFRSNSATTAGNVTLQSFRFAAQSGFTFDQSSAVAGFSVNDQFAIAANASLNAVIDTASGRLSFSSGAESHSGLHADVFSVSLTNSGLVNSVATGTMVITLTAGTSFAFLQEPDGQSGAGSCSVDLGTGRAAASYTTGASGSVSMGATNSGACNVLTATISSIATGVYAVALGRSGTATTTNSTVFAPQSYTGSASLVSGTFSLASLASSSAGSWTLDGTTATVAYVPISSSINLSVLVSNTSTQTGDVTFTAWNASSNSTCTGTLGTVLPGSQASFGTALRTALQACTGTGWSGASRATVTLFSTSPSTSTEIHTAFSTVDTSQRGLLINSTNSN